jgi:hypothetical protein
LGNGLDFVIGSADQNDMGVVHFDKSFPTATAQNLISDKKTVCYPRQGMGFTVFLKFFQGMELALLGCEGKINQLSF